MNFDRTPTTMNSNDIPKRNADHEELHALLQYAMNAGHVADETRRRVKDMQAELSKAEADAVNSWNAFATKLMEVGENIDGFRQSDFYRKLMPKDSPVRE